MTAKKGQNLKFYLILFILFALILFYFAYKLQSEKNALSKPISINLLTSVHPSLKWNFKPVKPKITVKPGEVVTVEYLVENFGDTKTTGIATFVYFPNQFGTYISKINCFCYDAQTLKPKQKSKFILVLLIDPEVTKDSKTKNIKEATIQFTFFDYGEYKDNQS
tara:strand:- start:253 stop:744 length:492 start_codon:yes stop_codon:yes gene_type:complete